MELSLKIPKEVYLSIKIPKDDIESILLLELAITLYQRQILSFGKARELAKMTKWNFHDELGKRKINRHYNLETLEEDLQYGTSNSNF